MSSTEAAAEATAPSARPVHAEKAAAAAPHTPHPHLSLSHPDLARTPPPPYVAVIFTSVHTLEDADVYGCTADRMVELAEGMPGYLGVESVRDRERRVGVTVSYWSSREAITHWRRHSEHVAAQRSGRAAWYEAYITRVAVVERDYAWEKKVEGRAGKEEDGDEEDGQAANAGAGDGQRR